MNASLRTMLSGLIDYAGLFPPAKLPLDEAIRNYARYRQGLDAWMLGRFVIPAARLAELDAFAVMLKEGPPFAFSVLGHGGEWPSEFLQGLSADYREVKAICTRFGSHVQVDALEVRLPEGCAWSVTSLTAEALGRNQWTVFFEASPATNEQADLFRVLKEIAQSRNKTDERFFFAASGFKLRTGGLDPSAFPSVEQVAFVLRACRDAGVPLKFTAGLHHPIRRFDASVQTHMHGFVNVFVAGVLAQARRLDEETLRAVIADEEPAHFTFRDDGLSWKDVAASTAEVAAARHDFVTSFGSCSFDEPRDDLRALGWL